MPEGAERASAAAATPARASDPPAARPATATAGPIPAAADAGVAAADLLAPGSPSLKRLLAAWLLVPLLLLVPVAAALQYAVTLRAALSSLDHSLGDTALALGQLLRAEADGSFVFDLSPQTEQSLRTDRCSPANGRSPRWPRRAGWAPPTPRRGASSIAICRGPACALPCTGSAAARANAKSAWPRPRASASWPSAMRCSARHCR
jgi:hypothetical protein